MLYKYRNINKNTIKIITNSELHFEKPKEFNDPFESLSYFDFKNIPLGFNEWVYSILKFKNDIKHRELKKLRKIEYIEDELSQDCNEYLISCFSEINDYILMWSHYANSHRGICLGFKPTFLKSVNKIFLEIEENNINEMVYPSFLSINHIPIYKVKYTRKNNYHNKNLISILTTKYQDWSYEKELRAIIPKRLIKLDNEYNNIKFKKEILTSIYLGVKSQESDKKLIIKLVKQNNPKIKIYEGKYHKDKIGIYFNRLNE